MDDNRHSHPAGGPDTVAVQAVERPVHSPVGSASTEGKRELTQSYRRWAFGRRLRRQAMLGE